MVVSFEVPSPVDSVLAAGGRDPSAAAKEATIVELYRQGKLSRVQLSQSLGISRFETDDLLKRHNVIEDLISPEEHLDDLRSIRDAIEG